MFLLTTDRFLNHCPMKLFVISQPQCKFAMLIFVVSHKIVLENWDNWGRLEIKTKIEKKKKNLKNLNFEFLILVSNLASISH